MTRLTRLCRAVGVGLAVATATLSMTQVAHAAPAPPAVPAALCQPAGNEAFLVGKAKGVQIYKCTVTAERHTFMWTFVQPRADLLTDNGQVIKHYAGPTWTAEPTAAPSSATRRVKSVPSPDPAEISLQLLPVEPARASNDRRPADRHDVHPAGQHQGRDPTSHRRCKAQTATR